MTATQHSGPLAHFSRRVEGWSMRVRKLRALGVIRSMRHAGEGRDKSAMESFFSKLEAERMNRKHCATRDAARTDVFDYIERFHNPIRRHSTLGNRSPLEFGQEAAVA